ncbi:MAG TPA: hypothetical protein VFX59_20175 [Polyangiales bacterium]|nr:hypothetical protein [Polyangiales bacterium]
MGQPEQALRSVPPVQPATLPQTLGSSERFFVSLSAFAPTNLARVIAIEGVLPAQRIAWALRQLQARHPLLRASVQRTRFLHRALEHSPPLTLRTEARRDELHWQRALPRLLDTPLHGPLELHYLLGGFGQRSELIVVADHALSDGVSINSLCAELLALCAQQTARPARPLHPVLDRMLPSYTPRQRARAFTGSLLRMARFALRRSAPRALSTAYLHVELSEASTTRLIERARKEATTITGALMAAATGGLRTALSVPVNLRPHLPELSAEDLGNYTSATYLEAQPNTDFWSSARALKRSLAVAVEPANLLAATSLVYRTGALFVRRQRPLAQAMISNSGLVPFARDYGAFQPVAFHTGTSAPMLSADYAFFCNTLHGRLSINLVYAPQVVRRGQAERKLARVRAALEADHV